MDQVLERKSTMHRFVSLAQAYRGWSKTQTAERLGREVAKVVPESGNPKLDLVVAIADALEWPVGDVAETLWRPGSGARAPGARTPFHELDAQSRQAHRDGRYHDMLELASLMVGAAASGNERAIALNRQCGAHDGLGQFMRSLSAVQQGLVQPDVLPRTRLMLRVNLASAHYALWHLVESRSIAHELVHHFTDHPPTDRFERVAQAFAFLVRGQSARRSIERDASQAGAHAESALGDLRAAHAAYASLARDFDDASYAAVARTCHGAILECEACLGLRDPSDAMAELEAGIAGALAQDPAPRGDLLESHGWWAVCACNVAARSLDGPALHRALAIFTNMISEIAEATDNWSLRERCFSIEHAAHADDPSAEWLLDRSDLKVLCGTMSRFPSFRPTGWRILERAQVLEEAS